MGQPGLVVEEELYDACLHGFGKGLTFGGDHAAEAHAVLADYVEEEVGVGGQVSWCVWCLGVDAVERGGEALALAAKEGFSELGLIGEVGVQSSL